MCVNWMYLVMPQPKEICALRNIFACCAKKSFGHLQGSLYILKKNLEKSCEQRRGYDSDICCAHEIVCILERTLLSQWVVYETTGRSSIMAAAFPWSCTHQKGSPAAAILPLVLYSVFPLSLLLSLNHLSANSQKFFCFALHKNTDKTEKKKSRKGISWFCEPRLDTEPDFTVLNWKGGLKT